MCFTICVFFLVVKSTINKIWLIWVVERSLKCILKFYKDFNQFLHFSIKHNKMTQFDETNSGDDQNDMTTKTTTNIK